MPGAFIAAALLPALVITLLFFFDHSVSSQMAQQPEFGLEKPSAYHYDFFLLGIMTIACGLIGVPPVNGVLPQVRQPQLQQQWHTLYISPAACCHCSLGERFSLLPVAVIRIVCLCSRGLLSHL